MYRYEFSTEEIFLPDFIEFLSEFSEESENNDSSLLAVVDRDGLEKRIRHAMKL